VLNDGSPRTVRTTAAVSLALAAAVVVAVIEWHGSQPRAAVDRTGQPPSGGESLPRHLPNPRPSKVPARSPTKPAEDAQKFEARQASTSSPPNGVAAGSETQRPVKNTQLPVDGVAAAKELDWDKVQDFAPIPRSLPARQAADAVDAGFVPEWFEHSIGRWTTRGRAIDGKVNAIEIAPLASRIMSESKDAWAQGVETQLRSIIASNLPGNGQVISRVFCSSDGCLCYLEDTDLSKHTRPTVEVTRSVLNDPQSRAYGITSQTLYVTGTGGWDLILISRTKPPVR
jgi:hypothetical protein